MWPTDEPPVSCVGTMDRSSEHVLTYPPSFAAQVRWLVVTFGTARTPAGQLVSACRNLRRLNVLAVTMNFPILAGPTSARSLAGLHTLRLQSVIRQDGADFVLVVDRLLAKMPVLRDLALAHSSIHDPAPAQEDPVDVFPHITRLALQRFEISALFMYAGLPLLGSQDSLRELRITLDARDSSAARSSLLEVLGRVTLRRLRHLALVNHDANLPVDFASRILTACADVRILELSTNGFSLDAYDWFDGALSTPGLRISALLLSSSVLFAETTTQMLRRLPDLRKLRALVLRCSAEPGDTDVERLREACRLRRIAFTHKHN